MVEAQQSIEMSVFRTLQTIFDGMKYESSVLVYMTMTILPLAT